VQQVPKVCKRNEHGESEIPEMTDNESVRCRDESDRKGGGGMTATAHYGSLVIANSCLCYSLLCHYIGWFSKEPLAGNQKRWPTPLHSIPGYTTSVMKKKTF